MNLLTVLLQAPAAGPDGSLMWIMLIAMFVIMYFFMIRPQNKKQKEIANFRKSLQVNQNVITAGGIHGTIKEITDDYIVLEIASNVKIKIDKNSIFKTLLCSVYHEKLIDNTIFQYHWAGRSTRGAAQFNGSAIDEMLNEKSFKNNIVVDKAVSFLKNMLSM